MDRKFALAGFGYAILGMLLGIHMASSNDHGQFVTHAHIMLLGFVVSFIYAICHKLWLNNTTARMATIQFYFHQVGAAVLIAGLFLMYGKFVAAETVEPVLGVASVTVLIGMILMKVLFIKSGKKT